jgi:hypothetical protein
VQRLLPESGRRKRSKPRAAGLGVAWSGCRYWCDVEIAKLAFLSTTRIPQAGIAEHLRRHPSSVCVKKMLELDLPAKAWFHRPRWRNRQF